MTQREAYQTIAIPAAKKYLQAVKNADCAYEAARAVAIAASKKHRDTRKWADPLDVNPFYQMIEEAKRARAASLAAAKAELEKAHAEYKTAYVE